jgi:hypothetical protein
MSNPFSPRAIHFLDNTHFELDGITFEYIFRSADGPSSPLSAYLLKERYQIECYEEVLAGFKASNILELGIRTGGSTIFLDRLLHPNRLAAIDIVQEPAPALTHYIKSHNRAEVMHPYYGVDQADKLRLTSILDEVFGDEQIDLVIDDASHIYTPTVSSFEVIFPRLRPGGLYVIEDWDGFHQLGLGVETVLGDINHPNHAEMLASLSVSGISPQSVLELGRFAMEATLLAACRRNIVREVRIRHNWIVIERGNAPLSRDSMSFYDLAVDRFNVLSSREGIKNAVFPSEVSVFG